MATQIKPQDIDTTQTFTLSASQFGNGSVGSPSVTFTSDATTGMWLNAAGDLRFTTGGTNRLALTSTVFSSTVLYQGVDGGASTPAYSFSGATATGIYRNGTSVNTSIAGSDVLFVGSSLITSAQPVQINTGTASQTPLTFLDTTDNQATYFRTASSASQAIFIVSANRGSGGNLQAGQAAANITITAANGDGNMTFNTTATNNAAPTNNAKLTKDGQFLFSGGSAAAPSVSFLAETGTGLFRSGASSLGITLSGTQIIEFDPGVITPGSDSTVALGSAALGWTRLFMSNGSAAAPSYTFRNNTSTGFFTNATNGFSVAAGGSAVAAWSNSSLNSNKRGILYLNDVTVEDGTSLFIGFGERTLTYSGNEVGWLDLSKGDAAGTYLGSHNQIRFMAGANVQASTNYASKDNTGRYFVLSPSPFTDDLQPIPGRTFTIGANTYTVRQYRNANSRLFVYEDISGEAASGTLTNVTYASVSMMAAANQIRIQDGSSASPALSFLNETNTGFFRDGSNFISASIAGTVRLKIGTNFIASRSGQHLFQDGSVSSPGIAFDNQSNTGIYRSAANDLSITSNGTLVAEFVNTKVIFSQPVLIQDGSAASPGLNFGSNQNTGIYRPGSNQIAVSTGGNQAAQFNVSGSSDGVNYNPFTLYGGSGFGGSGQNSMSYFIRTTASVGASPVIIGPTVYGLVIVTGITGGTTIFTDLLLTHYNTTPVVVVASKNTNSPAARTYSQSGDQLTLSMASGTYTVSYASWNTPIR